MGEVDRDRLLNEVSRLQESLAQEKLAAEKLRRELAAVRSERGSLQSCLAQNVAELAEAHALCESLEKTKATQKRLLHGMRSLACAECRLRSSEMEGIKDFFVGEPQRRNLGIAPRVGA